MNDITQQIQIFTSSDGQAQLSVALEQDTVWLSQAQMAELFDKDDDTIVKAVKSFIESYNDVVSESGESNNKSVLRNAAWLTGMTGKNAKLLSKAGITIAKGNKLELDEDTLKKADKSTLKSIFNGYNSFAGNVSRKASAISNASNGAGSSYTSKGTYYSKTAASIASGKIDKEV